MTQWGSVALIVGVLAIAAYFVVNATDQTTDCSGISAFNPACWLSSITNTATNELNTVLIILGLVIVLVIGLLAFGPQTGHIARGASALAVL